MTDKYTETLTFTRRGKDSDNGKWASFLEPDIKKWCRIHMGHADKVRLNEPTDVAYAVTDRGGVFINKLNGTDVSKAPQGAAGGSGAPSGGGGLKAQAQAKTSPAASGSAYEGAWAGMGPDNRARMVADAFVRDLYKGTGTHPGKEALARDFEITYQAWLQGCEGKMLTTAAAVSQAEGDMPPDYGGPDEDEVEYA